MSEQGPDTAAEEEFGKIARVALVAAGQIGQRFLESRQRHLQDKAVSDLTVARDLEQRITADRTAAEAQLAPVFDDKWWNTAELDDVSKMYATAKGWAPESDYAAEAERAMRARLVAQHGPEAEAWLDGAATDRLDADEQRQLANEDRAEAAALLVDASNAEQRDGEVSPEARSAIVDAEYAYDSAERRDDTAAALDQRGISKEAIGARMAADVSHSQPASGANVRSKSTASKSRTSRSRSASRNIQER